MKVDWVKKSIQKFALVSGFCFMKTILWAQDSANDMNIKVIKEDTTWYTQPWVWIIGGSVFLLALVALFRRGGNTEE
ncbi:MAG: hypothetical protein M3Z56_06285 [Bacteroidota bacterium]|nr:hypothetical protein [Bacteroidota bacterium]